MADGRDRSDLLDDDALRLVNLVAYNEFKRWGTLELREYEQAGFLALVECAERFDDSRGTAFVDFAKPRVRGAMRDELRKLAPERMAARSVSAAERLAGRGIETPRTGHLPPEIPMDFVIDPVTTLSTKTGQAQLAEIAREAMEELGPENRELAHALYVEDLSLRQYAERVGVAASTLSGRHRRLREVLVARILRRVGEG